MNGSKSLQLSDLIFNDNTKDVNRLLSQVRKSSLSISNRLRSISADADFVHRVAAAYDLPLIANERCGSWYIDPSRKNGSAYFKSTDGHAGQWSFSLRRLNLQVLDVVADAGGCVIVDSTRRGKSMPDALSKTVPIWIAVLNLFLFPDAPGYEVLHTPEAVVSASEHAQIASLLPTFVEQLKSLDLDLAPVRARLVKPLRPVWVTQESPLLSDQPEYADYYPIVLCTASSQISGYGSRHDETYVQGAADDSESWANGLTAALFWEHRETLLVASEDDLPALIESLRVAATAVDSDQPADPCTLIKPTTTLYIGTLPNVQLSSSNLDAIITCSPAKELSLASPPVKGTGSAPRHLHLSCGEGKVGSRQLRSLLPLLTPFMDELNSSRRFKVSESDDGNTTANAAPKILVACPSGKDHSVGVALTILCLYYGDDVKWQNTSNTDASSSSSRVITKHFIKQRLSWICMSKPDANPSRATLQSVNAFLLS